ncbi:MAG: hypothetical protein EBR13_03895, partial [Rhodobacteraceae bacterium]|nr:hypothetical protein [Paracoccaceae bacterium]
MLAPQDIGLGLNLGVAPSETLLDGAAMVWLRDIAEQGPTSIDARPVSLNAPRGLPQDVLIALDAKLAGLTGLAAGAYLALAEYADGGRSHILCFIDAAPEAHEALARAVSETHELCPFELNLDFARECDVIIADYNYGFDPRVRLRRFFDAKQCNHIFLIDEAHNLLS